MIWVLLFHLTVNGSSSQPIIVSAYQKEADCQAVIKTIDGKAVVKNPQLGWMCLPIDKTGKAGKV